MLVWWTLGIALLNLALGFLLSVHMHYMPVGYGLAGMRYFGRKRGVPVAIPELPASMAGAIQQAVARQAEHKTAHPSQSTLSEEPPEELKIEEKHVEGWVLQMNLAMIRSEGKSTDIDARLRDCRGQFDIDTVSECLEALKNECRDYMKEQAQLADRFHTRIDELGDLKSLGETIEMSNLEQAAQIETTISNLEHMDFQTDLPAAANRLLEEIDNLRKARHKLRDDQEMAYVAISRHEGRLSQIYDQLKRDRLTGLINRIGIETTLEDWWAQKRPQSHPVSAALIDLDGFASVNKDQGGRVGDRMLAEMSRWIVEAGGPDALVGRLRGQQFLVIVATGVHALTKNIELLRQSLEHAKFTHDKEVFQITASVALAEADPAKSPTFLLSQLDKTLAAAKKAGGNRSFIRGEEGPEPVHSPVLRVEFRTISV